MKHLRQTRTNHAIHRIQCRSCSVSETGQDSAGTLERRHRRCTELMLTYMPKVLELLNDVADYVHANEPGTLKYDINSVMRPAKDGTEEIVMIERYGVLLLLLSHYHIGYFAIRLLWLCRDTYNDLFNRYTDQQALKAHGTSEKFKAFQKTLADESLMRAPMLLKMVQEKGGFASRL